MDLYYGFTFLIVFSLVIYTRKKRFLTSGRKQNSNTAFLALFATLEKCLFPSLRMLLEGNASSSPSILFLLPTFFFFKIVNFENMCILSDLT